MVASAQGVRSGSEDDLALVAQFRDGDEEAFVALVRRYHGLMTRIACRYTPSHAVAEEVAQETWISVLRSIATFEGRSSFRTWLITILVNCARRQAATERRAVPFASLDDGAEAAVASSRFFPPDHPRWSGMWTTCVSSWSEVPDETFLAAEAMALVRHEIDRLPAQQRAVITLRDVCGMPAGEVCGLLDLTEGNERVLLHRARARVRRRLEQYVEAAC